MLLEGKEKKKKKKALLGAKSFLAAADLLLLLLGSVGAAAKVSSSSCDNSRRGEGREIRQRSWRKKIPPRLKERTWGAVILYLISGLSFSLPLSKSLLFLRLVCTYKKGGPVCRPSF